MKVLRSFAPVGLLLSLAWGGPALAEEPGTAERPPRIGELNGRHRVELGLGYFSAGGSTVSSSVGRVHTTAGADSFSFAVGYSYWMGPELSLGLSLSVLDSTVETSVSRGVRNEVRSVFSVRVGLRRDLLGSAERPRLRPYLTAALGPYFGSAVESRADGFGGVAQTRTVTAFGGRLGGGLDVQLSRLMMVGGRAGYDFMTDFSSPVGGEVNYSGFYAGLSVSFLLGEGSGSRD